MEGIDLDKGCLRSFKAWSAAVSLDPYRLEGSRRDACYVRVMHSAHISKAPWQAISMRVPLAAARSFLSLLVCGSCRRTVFDIQVLHLFRAYLPYGPICIAFDERIALL
jgi:hypothetical protein